MSLIPSESYSFPDHFTTTVIPSRKPKQEKPEPEKVHKKPTIVALPDPVREPEPEPIAAVEPVAAAEPLAEPEILSEIWEPEVPEIKAPPPLPPAPKPNPAIRRAQAPPPRIPETPPIRKIALPATLKPKVRWNNRAPAMDPAANRNNNNGNGAEALPVPLPPAQNVIPMRAARPAPPPSAPRPPMPTPVARPQQSVAPRQVVPQAPIQPRPPRKPAQVQMRPVQPRPAPAPPKPAPQVNSNPQADFFEMFAENGFELANKRRREMKFRRFVACEGAALLILLPLVVLGLTLNISGPILRWIMNISTIAAAIAAVVIPIVFYAATPTLPEIER